MFPFCGIPCDGCAVLLLSERGVIPLHSQATGCGSLCAPLLLRMKRDTQSLHGIDVCDTNTLLSTLADPAPCPCVLSTCVGRDEGGDDDGGGEVPEENSRWPAPRGSAADGPSGKRPREGREDRVGQEGEEDEGQRDDDDDTATAGIARHVSRMPVDTSLIRRLETEAIEADSGFKRATIAFNTEIAEFEKELKDRRDGDEHGEWLETDKVCCQNRTGQLVYHSSDRSD